MLTVRDTRLAGWRPLAHGGTVLEVDGDTPLDWFITVALEVTAKQNNQVYLRICCHGGSLMGKPSSLGGNGLVFCAGDLDWYRVSYLKPLKGKFRGGVDLYACGAAYINPGCGGQGGGDGNFFCMKMAQTLATNVRASTAAQRYEMGSRVQPWLDFGAWEGTVLTYGPKGDVIKVEQGAGAALFPEPLKD
jgi:hypothetical protein